MTLALEASHSEMLRNPNMIKKEIFWYMAPNLANISCCYQFCTIPPLWPFFSHLHRNECKKATQLCVCPSNRYMKYVKIRDSIYEVSTYCPDWHNINLSNWACCRQQFSKGGSLPFCSMCAIRYEITDEMEGGKSLSLFGKFGASLFAKYKPFLPLVAGNNCAVCFHSCCGNGGRYFQWYI